MLPNNDAIEKMTLRWRGQANQAYAPATQMRVERRFSELDFSPAGLPPNAVLYIRSVRNLSPLASLDFIPQNWEAEIRQQITTYYRQALHPIHGSIPTTAESVIFIDYADVLAALTPAVIAGRWWNEWPWADIIPVMQPSAALSTAWINYIQYLPAAFSLLTPSQIRAALHLLTPPAINRIIQELRSAFSLPEPTPTQTNRVEPTTFAVLPADENSTDSTVATLTPSTPVSSTEPPWTVWLPASLSKSDLSPQEHYLVGLIFGLHHAPAYVRSQTFTTQTARWLSISPAHEPTEPSRRVIITTRSNEEQRSATSTPTQTAEAATPSNEAIHQAEPPAALIPTQLAEAAVTLDEPALNQESILESPPDEGVNAPITLDGQWTRYGGILYLINLLGWLGMPQDWDAALTQHVSAWGLVELLARALLPDDSVDVHDAIWGILAELDKRDFNNLIAPDFPPQSTFRLPSNLLRRFAPAQPHWRATLVEDRLRLLDDTGLYLIAEQPLDGRDAATVVSSLLAEYQGQGISATCSFGDNHPDEMLSPFVTQICSPNLQTWLQRTMGFVRYWLRSIADLDPQELLYALGRILMTYTHVDLYMSIETIDIRIRKVGLDLNPGWMPDFGCIILFHFDE